MSQHDYVIANGTGAAVRSDLNGALAAIVTQNSGATAPATTYAYQWWADTTTGLLKLRNAANNAWITLFQLDGEWSTLAVENGSASAPSIYFKDSGTDTGFYSPAANEVAVATNGTGRLFVNSSGSVGIGTSSPDGQLAISPSGAQQVGFNAGSITSPVRGNLFWNTDGSGWQFRIGKFQSGTFTPQMTFVESGNVGIGTTSPGTILDVVGSGNPTLTVRGSDGAYTGIVNIQAAGGGVSSINATGGGNALKIETNSVERARIDSSGRLLVGTSTSTGSNALISLTGTASTNTSIYFGRYQDAASLGSAGATLGFLEFGSRDGGLGAEIRAITDGAWSSTSDCPSRLVFSVTRDGASSPTETLRITNQGAISTHHANSNVDGFDVCHGAPAGTTYSVLVGRHSASGVFSGTPSVRIYTNGNIQNTNGSYGTLSDARLKENIVDAGSQWDDLKAIQIRNWNFKAETGHETHRQIGPIAQELETVCPGLVFETPDRDAEGSETGEVTKGVNQSVLYMKAVKALQEAMERIEQLETEMAAVKAQLS